MSTIVLNYIKSCCSYFKIKNYNIYPIVSVFIFPNIFAFLNGQKFPKFMETHKSIYIYSSYLF